MNYKSWLRTGRRYSIIAFIGLISLGQKLSLKKKFKIPNGVNY